MNYVTHTLKRFTVSIFTERRYKPYGKCPIIIISTETSNIQGHVAIYEDDSNDEIAYKLVNTTLKICKENGINVERALYLAKLNLKHNNLHNE